MKKVWIEQGVIWALIPESQDGFRKVVKKAKQDIYVTSGGEGDHIAESFHYSGRAWDMRKSGFTAVGLRKVLGAKWDVVQYPWGFHCELDRLKF